jgi:hypothetical protein
MLAQPPLFDAAAKRSTNDSGVRSAIQDRVLRCSDLMRGEKIYLQFVELYV